MLSAETRFTSTLLTCLCRLGVLLALLLCLGLSAQAQGFIPEPPMEIPKAVEEHLKALHPQMRDPRYLMRRHGIVVQFEDADATAPSPKAEVAFDSLNRARYTTYVLPPGSKLAAMPKPDSLARMQAWFDKEVPGFKIYTVGLTLCEPCYTDPKTKRANTRVYTIVAGNDRYFFSRGGKFLRKEEDYLRR